MQKGRDEMRCRSRNRVLEKRPSWALYALLRVWFVRWGWWWQAGILLPQQELGSSTNSLKGAHEWRALSPVGSCGDLQFHHSSCSFIEQIRLPLIFLTISLKWPPHVHFFGSEFLSKIIKMSIKCRISFFVSKNMPAKIAYQSNFWMCGSRMPISNWKTNQLIIYNTHFRSPTFKRKSLLKWFW